MFLSTLTKYLHCATCRPCSYLVMPFMGTDLGKLMKIQRLSEEKIQYLVYQMLKGLKVVNRSRIRQAIQVLSMRLSLKLSEHLCPCSFFAVYSFRGHYSQGKSFLPCWCLIKIICSFQESFYFLHQHGPCPPSSPL